MHTLNYKQKFAGCSLNNSCQSKVWKGMSNEAELAEPYVSWTKHELFIVLYQKKVISMVKKPNKTNMLGRWPNVNWLDRCQIELQTMAISVLEWILMFQLANTFSYLMYPLKKDTWNQKLIRWAKQQWSMKWMANNKPTNSVLQQMVEQS